MASRDIKDLWHPMQGAADEFLAQCAASTALTGCKVSLSQTYRSNAEQDADYARGRTEPGHIITNARAGQSPHNCTLPDGTPAAMAFDVAIAGPDGHLDWNADDDRWQAAIEIGESLGLVSGSTFHGIRDCPHFEMRGWHAPASTAA